MPNDTDLHTLLKAAFLKDDRVSEQNIDASVNDGIVTLRGEVQSYRRKLVAQQIASSFDACVDIINELVVVPAEISTDDEVTENVSAALRAHADIAREAISVTTTEGSVTLSGHVGTHWERHVAEDVTLSVRGVRLVSNLLIVDAHQEVQDSIICSEIQDAIQHARGLRDAQIDVSVKDDVCILSGRVDAFWKKETAEQVACRFRLNFVKNEISVG